jgi:ribosomal protein S19
MSARSIYKFTNIQPLPFKRITSKVETKYKALLNKSFFKKKSDLLINQVDSVITPYLVGRRVMVYNGVTFIGFLIRRSMVGFPFYQLIRTKKIGQSIHVDKKSKKKKLKQK